LRQGRTVFFEDIHVDDIFRVISQEKRGSSQQYDCRVMLAGTETKSNS